MKKILFIAASIFALAACNKEVINAPVSEVGYLDFNLSADNGIKVETKAVTNEQLGEFWIKYSDQTVRYSELPEMIALTTGPYNVEAYNYTETEAETGKGHLRLYDTETVTISANQTSKAILECTPYSSEVVLQYTDNFSAVYDSPTFELTKGDRTVSLVEGDKCYFNNTPGSTIQISYQLKADGESSSAKEIFGGTLEVKNAYSLTVNIDIQTSTGELTFQLTASDILTGQTNTITINPYTGQTTTSGNVNNQ